MSGAITTAIASTTSEVTSIFTENLPVVMVVFAGLVALGIVMRLFKKFVGRKGA